MADVFQNNNAPVNYHLYYVFPQMLKIKKITHRVKPFLPSQVKITTTPDSGKNDKIAIIKLKLFAMRIY